MTKANISYSWHSHFVFRIPIFPNKLLDYKNILSNEIFEEAIYIASPELHERIKQMDKTPFDNLPPKLQITILKYLIRMSTRCTPFGIFAGCGVGTVNEQNGIILDKRIGFKAITRLDLNLHHFLAQIISLETKNVDTILFYPNNTLYHYGNIFRYIEIKIENGNRKYLLSQLTSTPCIDAILHQCEQGSDRKTIIKIISKIEDVEEEYANEFFDTLVSNSILFSEFIPRITQNKNMLFLIKRLENISNQNTILLASFIRLLERELKEINKIKIGSRINKYKRIENIVKAKVIKLDKKNDKILQTNLYIEPFQATLSKETMQMIKDGLTILNKLTPKTQNPILEEFKRKFVERYEYEEIPLTEALDPDIGIDFAGFSKSNMDFRAMFSGKLKYNSTKNDDGYLTFRINSLLFKKYCQFLKNGYTEINFSATDLIDMEDDWTGLPQTFPVIVSILSAGRTNRPRIQIKFAGGASSVNILGRYSNDLKGIYNIVKDLTNTEIKYISKTHIIAEIVYTPEDLNNGNIMVRPSFYNYEIPILSFSTIDVKNEIRLSDIMVSINDKSEIVLRSKSLNKFILVRNTTAHNFTQKTTPIYYFLSLMQTAYNMKSSFQIDWGNLTPLDGHFPRITYDNNIIISPARWIIYSNEIDKKQDSFVQIMRIKERKNIPDKVYLTYGEDNNLLIDFTKEYSLLILKSELKKGTITLEEYLFDDNDPLVTSKDGNFTNEIIVNFYKNK